MLSIKMEWERIWIIFYAKVNNNKLINLHMYPVYSSNLYKTQLRYDLILYVLYHNHNNSLNIQIFYIFMVYISYLFLI